MVIRPGGFLFRIAALLLYLLLTIPHSAAFEAGDEWSGLGPLDISTLGPSEVLRPIPGHLWLHAPETGRLSTGLSFEWINLWMYHIVKRSDVYQTGSIPATPYSYGSYLFDMEQFVVDCRFIYSLGRRWSIDCNLPLLINGAGYLDGFIEGVHEFLGVNQHRRDEWPRDSVAFLYVTRDGDMISLYESQIAGADLGRIALGGRWEPVLGNQRLSFRLVCTLPTSSQLTMFEKRDIDLSLQAISGWRWRRMYFYHGLTLTHYFAEMTKELALKTYRTSLFNTAEFPLNPNLSLFLHTVTGSPIADYPHMDKPIIELTLGIKVRREKTLLEFGLIENLFYFDNSPDFGIHFAVAFDAYD
ncbi:DUF3187 family protein [bacterium]|nr:DUF3187 family protein [candidate division CSSED10-310 bacterium]